MARYREKTPDELAWNDIRRRITRQLDSEIAAFREAVLNDLLSAAFDEHVKSLESGEELQIQSHVADWVADAMRESLSSKIDALDIGQMVEADNTSS